ncbi:NeuD/PglB/VioB family sugar acetyltransferase [uncultured Flavobacterium sp.]|uniref:NeuD/PglB/VioB family sugar acetyltransferase n=1 Tax=uncultured Flavobacterium sp. TaxID=165435 RepID=UPI0030CA1487
MEKIAIIGAGGFGREVKMLIDQINQKENTFEFIGYYDDGIPVGTKVNYNQVLGTVADLANIDYQINIVIAIATPDLKRKIVKKLTNSKINFPTLIHPSVLIGGEFVSIGKGCIICASTIITCNIIIKDFVILNLMCTVGHDTVINSFASFMPSVNISGEVIIHEEVYVGTGATIINQLEIGIQTIIGAGAVVSKTMPEKCTAVGIPAKPIKFHA